MHLSVKLIDTIYVWKDFIESYILCIKHFMIFYTKT